MVMISDCPDMTSAVYHGHKARNKTHQTSLVEIALAIQISIFNLTEINIL